MDAEEAAGHCTYCGDRAENLSDVEFVQDCRFACCVQSKHDHLSTGTPALVHERERYEVTRQCNTGKKVSYPHLLVPKDSVQHLPHGVSHLAPRSWGSSP